MKVLVVDDDQTIWKVFYKFLSISGYEVTLCDNGQAALEIYQQGEYPLVMTDIVMPKMNGIELCRHIRELPQGDQTFIIAMTAHDLQRRLEEVLDAGADDYLIKPIHIKQAKIRLQIAEKVLQSRLEHGQAEETLRKSEQRYRGLVEGLNEAMYRISLPDGKYEYFSPAAKEIFGYSPEEFTNNSYLMREIIHPDFVDYFEREWQELLNGKGNPTLEYKIIDPAEKEKWIIQSSRKVFDDQKKVIAIEGLCRDITKSKQAEEALADEKEQLAVTLRSIADGVIRTDINGKILLINKVAEELTGWTQEEAIGRDLSQVFHIISEETRELIGRPFANILKGVLRPIYTNYIKLIAKDGTEKPIANSGALIRDRENNIVGGVLIFRDVTEAQRLRQAKTNFLNAISHELRTPLTPIIGMARLMEEMDLPDNVKTLVEMIIRSAEREERLVEELLTTAHLERDTKRYNFVEKNAYNLFLNIAIEARMFIRFTIQDRYRDDPFEYSHTISENLKTIIIKVDPDCIRSIIENLLSNAIKYSPKGRLWIRLSAKVEENYIVISVEDRGVGVPKSKYGEIFEPFYQIRKSEYDISDGVGQGLSIVKQYVEAHSGVIAVESEMGKGTIVRFMLKIPS